MALALQSVFEWFAKSRAEIFTNVGLDEHRPLPISDRRSAVFFLHFSFLQATNDMMRWSAFARNVPQANPSAPLPRPAEEHVCLPDYIPVHSVSEMAMTGDLLQCTFV